MTRMARYIEPNGYYHVISRSVNETWIFKDSSDFIYFFALIRKAKKEFPILLFHYVLMNTHFHFVVQAQNKDNLSQHIAYIKWHYTMWSRRKYGWKGPMWRERYKNLPIENESYLTACGTYIEYNPVRAGICKDPCDYPYSSYQKYHKGVKNDLLDEYGSAPDSQTLKFDFRDTSSWKTIFSHSPAIGNSVFVEKWRLKK